MPTWEEWSEDLRAVLDAAGSESAAIFAEAEAGPTAILFAATHPERVRALVLGNTTARYRAAENYPIGVSPGAIETTVAGLEAAWGTPELIRNLFPGLAGDDLVVRSLARLCRAAGTPRMAAAQYRQVFNHLDVRDVLSLVHAPTLVLHNFRSAFSDHRAKAARYLAEHIDGARLVEVLGNDALFFGGDYDPVIDKVAEFLTGQRPPFEVDRILTTVLFTDIVGSTALAAQLGDRRWGELLKSFYGSARRELAGFRGREIDTAGDGLLASFDGPARAIRCACALTEAAKRLGVEIRAGLHTGECELIGDKVGGIAVHIGARVASSAGPGEVVVSSTVKDLVAGSGYQLRGSRSPRPQGGSGGVAAVRGGAAGSLLKRGGPAGADQ